jgi:hypothetical protein
MTIVGAMLVVGLTGCEFPDVSMSPNLDPPAAQTSSQSERTATRPTPTVAPTPTAAPRPAGDLDSGSLTRVLAAGDRSVVIDYWTAENATEWAPDGTKSIQLSAHVEGGGDEHLIKVTRFAVTVDDGHSRTVVTEDRGEFALTPPFSYTSALTVLPSPAEATELVMYVQFDLLVETEPGSEIFFRQTVMDSLRLPLVQEDSL